MCIESDVCNLRFSVNINIPNVAISDACASTLAYAVNTGPHRASVCVTWTNRSTQVCFMCALYAETIGPVGNSGVKCTPPGVWTECTKVTTNTSTAPLVDSAGNPHPPPHPRSESSCV